MSAAAWIAGGFKSPQEHRIEIDRQTAAVVLEFMFLGNSRIQVTSERTGVTYTYKVKAKKGPQGIHYVSVLTGPEGNMDFSYMGSIFNCSTFSRHRESKVPADDPVMRGFEYVYGHLKAGRMPPHCKVRTVITKEEET